MVLPRPLCAGPTPPRRPALPPLTQQCQRFLHLALLECQPHQQQRGVSMHMGLVQREGTGRELRGLETRPGKL